MGGRTRSLFLSQGRAVALSIELLTLERTEKTGIKTQIEGTGSWQGEGGETLREVSREN